MRSRAPFGIAGRDLAPAAATEQRAWCGRRRHAPSRTAPAAAETGVNTPGHAVVNLAVLGRRDRPALSRFVVAGAILPDLPIVAFYLWEHAVRGASERAIWTALYFDASWQRVFDAVHSIPLAGAGAVVSVGSGSAAAVAFFASMLLHDLCDLPLHADDAHRHLWPLSDWRFASPLSYWDPRHHGDAVALIEVTAVLISTILIWRRGARASARVALVVVALLYVVAYGAFYVALTR